MTVTTLALSIGGASLIAFLAFLSFRQSDLRAVPVRARRARRQIRR